MKKEIPDLNLFMMCKTVNREAFRKLPPGYSFRLCAPDELDTWKRLCAGEQYVDFVSDYFDKVYKKDEDEFFRRCTFVCNTDGKPVGTCYLWRSYGEINTIGWYRVLPEYEGKGIGCALFSEILKNAECPIYVHTHPSAFRAVHIYSDFGFELVSNPMIGRRKNDLTESLPYLEQAMPKEYFAKLRITEAPDSFSEIVLTSELDEF